MDAVIDRQTLAAFVDGALGPEEAARVVMHLADTPAAQAHVDTLLEINALLAAAFGAPMGAPVPGRIRATIARVESGPPPARRFGMWRRASPQARHPRLRRAAPYVGGAAAAAAAFALGVWTWPAPPTGTAESLRLAGPVAAGTSLYEALETRGSGVPVQGERGTEIEVIATYLDRDRNPCREFEVLQRSEDAATAGVACRDATSDWTVAFAASRPLEVEDPTRGTGAADPGAGAYVPASGVTDAAVSGALDALGAGSALGPTEEEDLITDRWRR